MHKQFQCCALYSSNQCYWPHKYTNWYFHMVLSNRSTQCLEAKPALPLKGKYQDSGPDAISLESSEWMCGITALMRFDTAVVYNPFEVRFIFLQWSKHNPQLQTLEVMVFSPYFSEILECFSEWGVTKKNLRVKLNFNKVRNRMCCC